MLLEVLAEGLRVKGIVLWFPALKPNVDQWQKATRECPCGWLGHTSGRCRCAPEQVARYRGRVAGSLIDRLDLAIEVPSVPAETLAL